MATKQGGRRSLWARIRRIWVTVGLTLTAVFVIWSLIAYRASAEAQGALDSDGAVSVTMSDQEWIFTPASGQPEATVGLLFFPGALVDPVAYAPLARRVASEGYLVRLERLPRRGAFGGADDPTVLTSARELMGDVSPPQRWVVGGHSRGGVITSSLASNPPPQLAGVVLIGTSHPRDVDLSDLSVPVTKVVGTRDGLASPEEVRANQSLLPRSTEWVWVEGGNHSQFGWYGFQPGDRRASISGEEQRELMTDAVLDMLNSVRDAGS